MLHVREFYAESRGGDSLSDQISRFLRTQNLSKEDIVALSSDSSQISGSVGERRHAILIYEETE